MIQLTDGSGAVIGNTNKQKFKNLGLKVNRELEDLIQLYLMNS